MKKGQQENDDKGKSTISLFDKTNATFGKTLKDVNLEKIKEKKFLPPVIGERVEQSLRETKISFRNKSLRQKRLLAQNLTNLDSPKFSKEKIENDDKI